jgi:hypothetical protein
VVSAETDDETEARLLGVIAKADFEVLGGDYCWWRMGDNQAPSHDAIACVRDGPVWSEFRPAASNADAERYRVVSFHFREGTDAAGFVAWLAGHLKRSAGTGAVVICGKDRCDSPELFRTSLGVFDYWCCPVVVGDKFVAVIRDLIAKPALPPAG